MNILPDVLAPGMKLVFCGSAASTQSAAAGAYYAGRGNRFWEILFRTGLTPRQLTPGEFRLLADYGVGLTDMAKYVSGQDNQLSAADDDPAGFRARIEKYAPKVVAFNGKRAAQAFYGRKVDYGRQIEGIGGAVVFVLPSTSGAARGYWDESHWQELADFVRYGEYGG